MLFFSSLNERLRRALNKIEIKDFVQYDCSMSSCDSSLTEAGEVPLILYVWLLASEVRFNLADKFIHEFGNLIETCMFSRFPQIQVFYKMYPGKSIFFWLCNSKSFWRERACENWQVLLWTWQFRWQNRQYGGKNKEDFKNISCCVVSEEPKG